MKDDAASVGVEYPAALPACTCTRYDVEYEKPVMVARQLPVAHAVGASMYRVLPRAVHPTSGVTRMYLK